MSLKQALQGKTIVVTRPRAQAAKLSGLIAAEGGKPVVFPLLDIGPADAPAPLAATLVRREGNVGARLKRGETTAELLFFPDGRAIVKGTQDVALARSLYARYVGT